MADTLTRRRILQTSALAAVSLSGCLEAISASPIPFNILNKSDQTETITVELFNTDTETVLLSETVTLNAGDKREFNVGPLETSATYTVEYRGTGHPGEDSIGGSGLHSGEVVIGEDGKIHVFWTVA